MFRIFNFTEWLEGEMEAEYYDKKESTFWFPFIDRDERHIKIKIKKILKNEYVIIGIFNDESKKKKFTLNYIEKNGIKLDKDKDKNILFIESNKNDLFKSILKLLQAMIILNNI